MRVVRIARYLSVERIAFLQAPPKHEVLRILCELSSSEVNNPSLFLKSIYERERIMSTGLGMGTAFPHVKIPSVPGFFITVGIIRNGVEWDSFDGDTVKIVFLIGGPDGHQNHYLGILSKLCLIVKNRKNRENLINAQAEENIIKILEKF